MALVKSGWLLRQSEYLAGPLGGVRVAWAPSVLLLLKQIWVKTKQGRAVFTMSPWVSSWEFPGLSGPLCTPGAPVGGCVESSWAAAAGFVPVGLQRLTRLSLAGR